MRALKIVWIAQHQETLGPKREARQDEIALRQIALDGGDRVQRDAPLAGIAVQAGAARHLRQQDQFRLPGKFQISRHAVIVTHGTGERGDRGQHQSQQQRGHARERADRRAEKEAERRAHHAAQGKAEARVAPARFPWARIRLARDPVPIAVERGADKNCTRVQVSLTGGPSQHEEATMQGHDSNDALPCFRADVKAA